MDEPYAAILTASPLVLQPETCELELKFWIVYLVCLPAPILPRTESELIARSCAPAAVPLTPASAH